MAGREESLVPWQWSNYPHAHRDRRNLLVHILTVPMFMAGTVAVPLAAALHWALAPAGLAAMALAMALQGRTHKLEERPPEPFLGPGDVVGRIFAEQWINFPRFVASGRFARAWRSARRA
jgi:hypothetical protein